MASPPAPRNPFGCNKSSSNLSATQVGGTANNNRGHETILKQTEDLLAKEMIKLSVQERAAAFDDVHCVGEEHQETPEMVQKALADFERAVHKETRPIYELAVKQDRSFVENPTFRLKFLRANFYDIEKSVRQMMDFLFYKAKYFGQDKVAREITLLDMSETELDLMLSGLYHIQDSRDRMGRVVVHNFGQEFGECTAATLNRLSYYFWWNIVGNIHDAQTKGIAAISYSFRLNADIGFLCETIPFFNSLPRRVSVVHCCVEADGGNLGLYDSLLRFALSAHPQSIRVRSRIHYGSRMETQYQLKSHGIPIDHTFPLDTDGNPRVHLLNLWFEKHLQETNQSAPIQFGRSDVARVGGGSPSSDAMDLVNFDLSDDDELLETGDQLMLDQMMASIEQDQILDRESNNEDDQAGGTISPADRDVLFGRGFPLQSHPGNVRFRSLLEQHRQEYDSCARQKRREIPTKLVHSLRASGVQFLLQTSTNGEWVENSIAEASKKVGQVFRELRKKSKREDSD